MNKKEKTICNQEKKGNKPEGINILSIVCNKTNNKRE